MRPQLWIIIYLFVWLLITPIAMGQTGLDEYAHERRQLVQEIEADVRQTSSYIDKIKLDPRVLAAIGKVPRHQFVPRGRVDGAYENRPLPIGHGQTISQPYIVALMTDLVQPKKTTVCWRLVPVPVIRRRYCRNWWPRSTLLKLLSPWANKR